MTDLYAGYDDWKGWDASTFMQIDPVERAYFDREVGTYLLADADVLEIGFGNGAFLAWLRDAGARVHGTELSAQGIALASTQGVTVLPIALSDIGSEHDGKFALIAAFDVLEHLSPAAIRDLLQEAVRLLRPGGRFLARFPNGQSPFGRINQASDFTHLTTLSPTMIAQIARGLPVRIIAVGEDLQVVHGSLLRRFKQRVQIAVRKAAGRLLKWTFRFDAPLGVNVTVTLERTSDQARPHEEGV